MTAAGAEHELCAPTEGPVWAYYGRRAVERKSTKGEPLHAISLDSWSMLGGAMDTECGVIAAIPVGPWDPDAPINCRKCAQFVAGEMPIPPGPLVVPAPELVVVEELPVQLVLDFAA